MTCDTEYDIITERKYKYMIFFSTEILVKVQKSKKFNRIKA